MIAVPYPPGFIATTEDTDCAAQVNEPEFSHLVRGLDKVVMPALRQATHKLHGCDFKPLQIDRKAGLASVVVQRDDPMAHAWLYFQIHRSLGPCADGECVFWMYAIHHPAGTTAGRPGRLANLEESREVEEIVAAFVQACAEAPRRRDVSAPMPLGAREAIRSSGRRGLGVFASA